MKFVNSVFALALMASTAFANKVPLEVKAPEDSCVTYSQWLDGVRKYFPAAEIHTMADAYAPDFAKALGKRVFVPQMNEITRVSYYYLPANQAWRTVMFAGDCVAESGSMTEELLRELSSEAFVDGGGT